MLSLAGLLLSLGCDGETREQSSPAESVPAAAAPAPGATASSTTRSDAPAGADCPLSGDWQQCNVEDRLTRAGLVFEREAEPVRHDFLSVPGTTYTMHNARVQIFLYPDAAARARDTDPIDTTTVAPPGKRVVWPEPATLVVTNNLAAIILSLNGRLSERIALAIGAGLPAARPNAAR